MVDESTRQDRSIRTEDVRARFNDAGDVGAQVERARVLSALQKKMFDVANTVQIGRFVVDKKLGEGAMGVVYAAHDPELDRKVALKVLREPDGDHSAALRLEREARALAKLRHPNVVTVHEVGTHDGDCFIAMDLVEGETLRSWLNASQSWREVLAVMLDAGRGLAAAHDANLIHRDFKPDNVLVEQGQGRVADFGLARPRGEVTAEVTAPMHITMEHASGSSRQDLLTRTGALVGTPAYMAPEALGGSADAHSDQFSYCVTLYEALYGVRPFAAGCIEGLRQEVIDGRFERPVLDRKTPRWLHRAVLRGLAIEPTDRWPDMAALLSEFERRSRRSPGVRLVAVGVGCTLVGLVAAAAMDEDDVDCAQPEARLDQVWSAARKKTIREAFAATEFGFAEDASRGAITSIDSYVDAWSTMRREACEATYDRSEVSETTFDTRIRCLKWRLDEVDALAAAFESPDSATIQRAVSASRALTPLDECADEEVLRALLLRGDRGETAPDSMQSRLIDVRTLVRVGKYEAAVDAGRKLAADADDGDFFDVAAAVHLTLSGTLSRLGDKAGGEAEILRSMTAAERLGDDRNRFRAQTVYIAYLAGRSDAQADAWLDFAGATLTRLGTPDSLRGQFSSSKALVLKSRGKYDQALLLYQEVIALHERQEEPDDIRLARLFLGMGDVLYQLERPQDSLEALQRALALRVAALGENHPHVARVHREIASCLASLGRIDQSIASARRALEVSERGIGPKSRPAARGNSQLAIALAQGPHPKESLPYFRRSIAILEELDGPDSAGVYEQLGNLGRVLATNPESTEAIPVLTRVLKLGTKLRGKNDANLMYESNNLTLAFTVQNRLDEALVAAHNAIDLAKAAKLDVHSTVAEAWMRLGIVQRELGEFEDAETALNNSLAMFDRLDIRKALSAEVHVELARLYIASEQQPKAVQAAQRARQGFVEDPQDNTAWLALIDGWLADPSAPL